MILMRETELQPFVVSLLKTNVPHLDKYFQPFFVQKRDEGSNAKNKQTNQEGPLMSVWRVSDRPHHLSQPRRKNFVIVLRPNNQFDLFVSMFP